MTGKSHSLTIRDIARQAGVSVATVSRYINKKTPISADVAQRIQQVMQALSYKPVMMAQTLATHRTQTIGLVLHNMLNGYTDFFAPLLRGIEAVVVENQYNLLISTYKSPANHDSLPPLGLHNTDGLLVFADSLSDEHLGYFSRTNLPMVLIHRPPPPNLNIPSVSVANEAITKKMIDHLIEVHGRRSILFLRGPHEQEDSHARERGYLASLQAHNITPDASFMIDGDFNGPTAYQAIKCLVAGSHHYFDAIFTGNDDAAIGVLTALKEAGLRIPEDVAVVGFDDLRLSSIIFPPLTTVRAPTKTVGRTAAQLLFDQINGEPPKSVMLQPEEIIFRRSCGCLPVT